MADTAINFEDITAEELSGGEGEKAPDPTDPKTASEGKGAKGAEDKSSEDGAEGTEPNIDEILKEDGASTPESVYAKLGLNPQNASGIVKQAQTAEVMTHLLEHNPELFLQEVEKHFPQGFKKIVDVASDRYLQMYDKDGSDGQEDVTARDGKPAGKSQSGPNDRRIERMEAELAELKGSKQREAQEQAIGELKSQYRTRLDGLTDRLAKATPLSARDQRAIKAQVFEAMSNDPASVGKMQQGDFSGLATHFKAVATEWFKDVKKSNDAEHDARKGVQARGEKPMVKGAFPAAGETEKDDWDTAAESFADSLIKAGKK